ELIEREGDTDDVADGIDGADFVEVHLFNIDAVDGGFGFAQRLEDAFGGGFGAVGRSARIHGANHFDDAAEVAVLLRLIDGDGEFGGGDAAALHARPGDGRARRKGFERAGDGGLVGSGIGQSADQHIAGQAGEGVNVASSHDDFSGVFFQFTG